MASATAESIVRAMRFSSSISAGANGSTSSSTRGTYEAMAALALSARPATTEADASKSRTAGGTKLHAKCPKCTAATNNVRPFRDGCRRCKGPTTVYMWCATPHEVTQAHDSFPAQSEEVEHTALVCELCQSVIFPRAREMLTKRTAQHPLTSSQGKPLKVSNFQLSMPHVEGCTRKGMPVQTSAIQLPKSELKFVLDRIDQCPFVPRIQGGPQYRKRETVTITQQNHLHQLYLRLLSSIVKTFRPDVPMAAEPLRKLVDFFSNVEPLSLFPDWSLPQQFSKAEVKPIKVQSSSQLDDQHSPQKSVLSLEMQRIMLSSMSQFDTPLLDSRMVQRMTAHLLAHESSDNASSAMLWSNTHDLIAELTKVPNEDDDQADRNESTKESQKEGSLIPVVIFAVCNPSFTQSIKRRSQMLGELSTWQMKRMQKAEEFTGKKEELLTQLEEPFAIEVSPQSFDLAHQLLKAVLQLWLGNLWQQESPEFEEEEVKQDVSVEAKKARLRPSLYTKLDEVCKELIANSSNQAVIGGPGAVLSADSTAIAILQIVTSNIRRLVLSHIDPADIGIEPAAFESHDSLPAAPPALDPLVCLLEQLVSLGAKRTDRFFPVSLKAAAAVEVGMEAFYPSAQQRTLLLTSRMGKGATIEVQCIKLGLQHTTRGSWQFYMHLIVEIPPDQSTEQTLQRNFAQCIQRAGFSSWQVIAGAQEISINLQRHLHWNRVEKMSQDSGSGWIRIYPRDVATFDDVLVDVNGFISHHEDHSRCEGAHP
ncbi:TPA: hypothetical protein N0F65_002852 [Lagenidium giganteum]|uniref:Uncharacterized protein n=1 Tax=Lagenidium giganteum TaxID=4803 RepID=A0AAV2ZBN5_9STRA|nr:TPA: hypothetical protein N0F65_002852 [Lagenidium giganteum]